MSLLSPFGGINITSANYAVEHWTDWSGCRSVGRAKRRARQGKPQRCVLRTRPAAYQTPNGIICHPDIFDEILRRYPAL